MNIFTHILTGPITPDAHAAVLAAHAPHIASLQNDGSVGALLRFDGIVRRAEPSTADPSAHHDLLALDYQTYDPMAQRELDALAHRVATRYALYSLIALHSRGRVHVGEVSFVLQVAAPHRAEALAAMTDFIDDLKRDVPIWKHPVWAK